MLQWVFGVAVHQMYSGANGTSKSGPIGPICPAAGGTVLGPMTVNWAHPAALGYLVVLARLYYQAEWGTPALTGIQILPAVAVFRVHFTGHKKTVSTNLWTITRMLNPTVLIDLSGEAILFLLLLLLKQKLKICIVPGLFFFLQVLPPRLEK